MNLTMMIGIVTTTIAAAIFIWTILILMIPPILMPVRTLIMNQTRAITDIKGMVFPANITTTMVAPVDEIVPILMPPTIKVNVMYCES